MNDIKLTLKALGVWWVICFIPILVLGTLLIPLISKGSVSGTTILIVSIVLATAIDLLLYYVIFPKALKKPQELQALIEEVNEKGITEELKNNIITKYNECLAKKDIYGGLFNEYALILATYYIDNKDFKKAYEYLDSIDEKHLSMNVSNISGKYNLVRYCCMKLMIECAAKDMTRAKNTYNLSNQTFGQYGQETELESLIAVAIATYDNLRGREDLAIRKIESVIEANDGLGYIKFVTLAEAYKGLDENNRAIRYYKEALRIARNEKEKQSVLDELKVLENK